MNREVCLDKLNRILEDYNTCTVAFSGGVDRTFLLAAAIRVLGKENVTAITCVPPYVADWEITEAGELAEALECRHLVLQAEMLDEVSTNPTNRCYVCKTALFSGMLKTCAENGYGILCDGTNADDTGDYRPGMKALQELGIKSPLLKAGMTKGHIRSVSRESELPTWDKPPYACLLTRLPHDTKVTRTVLDLIEKSEVAMMEEGFPYVRVRHHNDIARIEIPRDQFEEFIVGGSFAVVADKLKQLQEVLDSGAVSPQATAVIDYWRKRDVAGLLLMPATRHPFLHLNTVVRMRRAL